MKQHRMTFCSNSGSPSRDLSEKFDKFVTPKFPARENEIEMYQETPRNNDLE